MRRERGCVMARRAIARCSGCDSEYVTNAGDVEIAERNGWPHHCRPCHFERAARDHDRLAVLARRKRDDASESRANNVERFKRKHGLGETANTNKGAK